MNGVSISNASFYAMCSSIPVIVKASSGPRYVVSYRPTLPVAKLKSGTRVSLDMTTLTIMRILPREVDPMVYKMSLEDPGGASFAGIGGLGEQVRELREVIISPLSQPLLDSISKIGY
jgi:26S proteasome regulatory subunit T4